MQHPFPAQGQTTDTAHLIVGEHTTQEGSYVALTRARDQTHIHAAGDGDRIQELAERMGRTEPEVPSIRTPLAHESAINMETEAERNTDTPESTEIETRPVLDPTTEPANEPEPIDRPKRTWPRQTQRDAITQRGVGRSAYDDAPGWEP